MKIDRRLDNAAKDDAIAEVVKDPRTCGYGCRSASQLCDGGVTVTSSFEILMFHSNA